VPRCVTGTSSDDRHGRARRATLYRRLIDRTCGVLMIGFGVKLATSN
jgi:threonine/homoserine/homoserine lactone efflux protein